MNTRRLPAIATVVLSGLVAALAFAAAEPATMPSTQPSNLQTKCVVSDEALGEMGDPVVLNYEGREVKFCCESCIKKFKKDPAKYLKKLDEQTAGATTQPTK